MPREPGPLRIVALCVPELPLQRARRARAPAADGGRPLAVVSEGRVLHCDPLARAAGVRAGETVAQALAACGRLATVPLDPAAEAAALRALAESVLALAPAVEVSAPDALLLDASAAHLLVPSGDGGDPEIRLAERAVAAAAEMGYAARAAVATGRAPARALARHAPADAYGLHGAAPVLRVPPGEAASAIAALPLEALGLAPDVAARLRAIGVGDPGALARLPTGTLAHRFGAAGVAAARLARGEDDAPLVAYAPETLPRECIDLDAPAESAEPLLFALKRLADRVAARLAGRGLGATRLRLVLRLDPRGEERVLVSLAHPTASAARWLAPAKEHLFSLRLPGAVTALALTAVEVAPIPPEQLAIGDRPEALAALETVLARLAVRLGDGALFAAEPVERYRPEAAYRPVPFRPATPATARGWGAGAGNGGPPAASGQGTLAALHASAPVADRRDGMPSPRASAPGRRRGRTRAAAPPPDALRVPPPGERPTRLLAKPSPIVAEGEGGRLTALRVDGRARAVLAIEGPERLRGEWWSSPFERDYYRVRLEALGACWVYRDAGDGRLYLHGFFD
jgi:protein ImuB